MVTVERDPVRRLQLLQRIKKLQPYQWLCADPDCDGQPHPGAPVKHARAAQRAPGGDWWAWFLISGRGFGKTRTASEWVKGRMLNEPGHRVGIVVPDFGVGRDICVEGESGLRGLNPGEGVIPRDYIAKWNRSIGELELTNGSIAKIFGTDKRLDAEALRGFQSHSLWYEEIAVQRYGALAWDMGTFTCRLGDDPRVVITSTPRPTKFVRSLVDDEDIVLTHGSTYDNHANLAAPFLARLRKRYEGSTLGRQELYGELLAGSMGALWTHDMFTHEYETPEFARVVVAVDPAGSAHATSDETGIVVMGLAHDGRLWVLADKTGRYSPEQWRAIVCGLYEEYGADAVVGEKNYGGDMVAANLRAGAVRPHVRLVSATRGKAVRAEPVVTLYEQKRVVHVGVLAELEDEMTTWVPPGQFDPDGEPIEPSPDSPNRIDATVWAAFDLALRPSVAQTTMSFSED